MAARGITRQQILDTAARLFQQQGYHATGLNQIITEAAAPKGTLYFHFPGGKKQLAAETIIQSADRWGLLIDQALAQAGDLITAAEALTSMLATMLEQSGFRDGCPLATVALDTAGDSDQIRAACARGYQRWIDLIAARLRQYGVPAAQVPALSTFTLSSIEGAILLSRVQHDTAPLHQAARHLITLITSQINGHGDRPSLLSGWQDLVGWQGGQRLGNPQECLPVT
jgi:TetR/AcrR family transcriptional repressor of lmrAB and yxaGH operons